MMLSLSAAVKLSVYAIFWLNVLCCVSSVLVNEKVIQKVNLAGNAATIKIAVTVANQGKRASEFYDVALPHHLVHKLALLQLLLKSNDSSEPIRFVEHASYVLTNS